MRVSARIDEYAALDKRQRREDGLPQFVDNDKTAVIAKQDKSGERDAGSGSLSHANHEGVAR